MRIVTRPDFDGIACAVILREALQIREPVLWVEPNEMQKGLIEIYPGDVIANLPFNPNCSLWFDHHYSNEPNQSFEGDFRIAPSAAGIVFAYYREKLTKDFTALIEAADKIDSADLTEDEVLFPEGYPYVLLSMTIVSHNRNDEPYWNRLVDLFRSMDMEEIMKDEEVNERCRQVLKENQDLKKLLLEHTTQEKHVSVTDFRSFEKAPTGNRFLVYSLFPKAVVSMKIRMDEENRQKVIVSLGHSIFNRNCNVNVGKLLSRFEGGGHKGAAACSFHVDKFDDYLPQIMAVLLKNNSNE